MSIHEDDLAQMIADDDGMGCAITRTPAPVARDLARYLEAKHAYEDMVHQHALAVARAPGDPWPARIKQAEARVDAIKAAGGEGQPGNAPCCRRYGRLHEPVISLPGCPWYGHQALAVSYSTKGS